MWNYAVTAESILRLSVFLGMLLGLLCLEGIYPRRSRVSTRIVRWVNNVGISALNQIVLRVIVPGSTMTFAGYCAAANWGLLNQFAPPPWLAFTTAVLALDFAIYAQHRLYHVVPIFWRLHRMHHADVDFDVTTGIRFHPLSIVLSALIKLLAVFVIGPSIMAVLVFEILLNATSLFNHSNLNIPRWLEKNLRAVVVTPDMHRVHHSVDSREMNRNFGFNFPWWDRIFGTYLDQPALGHREMVIGLEQFRDDSERRIDKLLTQPFRSDASS